MSKDFYIGKKAAFLGDSITFGYGLQAGERVFPEIVGDLLGLARVDNHGISGSSVASGGYEPMCERLDQLDADVDILFFMGGRNDFSMGTGVFGNINTDPQQKNTFYGALKYIAETLITLYPSKLIVFVTPPHGSSDEVPEHLPNQVTGNVYGDYVEAIREVASHYSLPCCDLWNIAGIQPLLPVHRQMYFTGEDGIPDGLHPNQAGHQRLAERLSGFLKTLV
ncbi:SGNH/GDSL hydrolase family protein [Paenibacillus sp. WLX2291]|uniref:SGNH/GDSL hydrolase family protein n=1 Tax=Paenibacillus sp. WLX2291 TaxID=3296934 RepID=UPI0039844FE3